MKCSVMTDVGEADYKAIFKKVMIVNRNPIIFPDFDNAPPRRLLRT